MLRGLRALAPLLTLFLGTPARGQGDRLVPKAAPLPSRPTSPAAPRPGRIEGAVLLRGTRDPLVGGRVIAAPVDSSAQAPVEAETDARGRFRLEGLPQGRYRVVVAGAGIRRYEQEERLGPGEALTVNYFVEPTQYGRYETTVRAEARREEVSRQTLSTEELVKMPGSMGDALRAVENLPGVARAPFNTGLIIVRGGKPTDSRVFQSGAEVPQLYHFGGLTGVVPTQLIDHIDFYGGNFGVRYGRAIAGVIDLDLRAPKRDRFHGAAETNVFDTGLMVEGPLGKGAFALAARRSYVDAILGLALPKDAGLGFTTAPVYYDYQGVLDYPLGGGKLRLSISGSDDQLKLIFDRPQDSDPVLTAFGTHIFFHRLQLRWTRSIGSWQLLVQSSTGYTGQSGALGRALSYDVWSIGTDLRLEARHSFSPRLKLLVGTDTQYAQVHLGASIPPPPREGQIPSPLSAGQRVDVDQVLNVFNLGLYAELSWKPHPRLTLTPGLRFDYFSAIPRTAFNPRLAARLELGRLTALRAGIGLYSQDPQPPDYNPAFGNPQLRPESALHAALTLEQAILPGLTLEATLFYKHLYDLAASSTRFLEREGRVVAERVASDGVGRVYGGEMMLRQALSRRFFGWISYTLMRSERRDCPSCAWRLFDFDQTHVLILAAHAYLPRGWEVGLRFRYITGRPYTPAYGGYYDADGDVYTPAQGPANTARLAAFHSLDLRVDKTFLFKRWLLKVYLDLTNVYNRRNQELIQPSYDYSRQAPLVGLPFLPSFGIRGEF